MSLIKQARLSKERKKNIVNTDSAKAYQVTSPDNPYIRDFCLELNGSFKMVLIKYIGEDIKLLGSNYNGLSITHGNKKIIVRNLLNVDLVNNILFQFDGLMVEIKFVRVYKWYEKSTVANIELPSASSRFNNDSNIISNPVYKFKDTELTLSKRTEQVAEVESKFKKDLNRKRKNNDSLIGLYTNGTKLMYKGRKYKGNYHYNKKKKQFMSGKEWTMKSVKLDKIFRAGESLKNKGRRLSVGGLGNPDPRKPRL